MATNRVMQDAWLGPSIAPSNSVPENPEKKKALVFPKFADLFRVLGGAALVLAGVIYMLQGLEDVTSLLRQWVWLGLIGVMALAGYFCRMHLDDVKSARIFFILATGLISAQFSQLGGMLLDIYSSGTQILSASADVFWHPDPANRISPKWFLLDFGLSVALAIVVSFVGFAILLRKSVTLLSSSFILLNLLILVPGRGPVSSIFVVIAMAGLLFVARYRIMQSAAFFQSLSGRLVRGILLFPLVLVLVRNSFYIDSITGVSAIVGLVAALCIYAVPVWFSVSNKVREISTALGGVVAIVAWVLCATSFPIPLSVEAAYLLPIIALMFELARVSVVNAALYRNLACLLGLIFSVHSCVLEISMLEVSLSLMLGLCMGACGFVFELKRPLMVGVLMTLLSVGAIMFSSLSNLALNTWLFLAIGGVCLVLISSVIEKYSASLLKVWQRVNEFA